MYRACIFDLDGTIANTLESIAYFGNMALSKFGLPPIDSEEYRLLVGNGADTLIRRMAKATGAKLSADELKAMRTEYDFLYESEPMRLVTPYPGVSKLLSELKGRGFRLGVLSNKPDNMTNFIVRALYGDLFDIVQGQVDGMPKKPDPTAVLNIAREFSLTPKEILYIGDSGVDMKTGQNSGMDTVGVLWGFRSAEELEKNGANHIVSSTEKILEVATGS